MKYVFEKIVEKSDKYLIFGGAARDYLTWFNTRNSETLPNDIDVLLNPLIVKNEEDARCEFDEFSLFVYEKFGGFEVKKANYRSSNFIGKSFAIPFYNGPVFSSELSVMFKIDIVYKVSGYFNVDFNVNSLVFSRTGVTTLDALNKINKEEDVDALSYVQLMGLTCRGVSRIYENIRDKKCFGMFKIDVFRLRKMLYKGYTCYTLVQHLEYNKRSIFLKYRPLENIVHVTTVMVDDGFEFEGDKYIQEKYYSAILKISDVTVIPYNDRFGSGFCEHKDCLTEEDSEEYSEEFSEKQSEENSDYNPPLVPYSSDEESESEEEEELEDIPPLVSDSSDDEEKVRPDDYSDMPKLVSVDEKPEERDKLVCALSFLTNNSPDYYKTFNMEDLQNEYNEYFQNRMKMYDINDQKDSDWENLYYPEKIETATNTLLVSPLISPNN
jgi:hypothetical protein